jgi:hypothetical protein
MQTRRYSASTALRSDVAASISSGGDIKTPAPAGSSTTRIFFVQRPGAKGYAALPARGNILVSFLVEDIQKKLRSLRDVDGDSITLQLASADGTLFTTKDTAGNQQPVTLDGMDTIDEALKKAAEAAGRTIGDKDKLRIIVDVAAPAAAPAVGVEGECAYWFAAPACVFRVSEGFVVVTTQCASAAIVCFNALLFAADVSRTPLHPHTLQHCKRRGRCGTGC